MIMRSAIRLCGFLATALALIALTARPAHAQFASRAVNDQATGEQYHIEGSVGLWFPTADMSISSESLGIRGTTIDFKNDLGLTDQHFPELHAVLRPSKRQKFRFQYIPITFEQEHTLTRQIIFNGQAFNPGVSVKSTLEWSAYRFAYEYDFISRSRGFAGVILEAKYTDVRATLASTSTTEFTHAQAPIPAIGGIVRVYVVPNISITAELSGVKTPDSVSDRYKAHYADFDMYGTMNFTNNIGAQLGYRTFDVGYLVNKDSGSFVLNGIYFGVVARY